MSMRASRSDTSVSHVSVCVSVAYYTICCIGLYYKCIAHVSHMYFETGISGYLYPCRELVRYTDTLVSLTYSDVYH